MQNPKTARAALMTGPGREISLAEVPIPDLEPESALFKVELSEVCGTDVHLRAGKLAGVPYPIIPGHVSVGILERIRGTMRDVDGRSFAEGDRVTFLDVHQTCHQCWYCLVAKVSTRCPRRKVYGITYGLADGLTGGWAEYIYLKPGTRCIGLHGVPDELFMAGGCSLPTALHAVERADVALGDTVLVLGSGPVGLSTVGFAALRGAAIVLCIGAPDDRLNAARKMGADATLNFLEVSERRRGDWVAEHTAGRGADVTVECTGVPDAVTQAMRFTRDGGRVVIVGQYTDHGETAFNPHADLNRKHLDVRGCWGSDYSHFHRGVDMLRSERAARLWSALQLEQYPLSQANQAVDRVAAGQCIKALIVP
jgi:L-iditol 2-dehydrogenase